jgi:putative CocE/NonD family hydrolase
MDRVWITMTDGVRLSARIWLPDDAVWSPVPAILEYIPYRKDDATAVRDAGIHPYLAGHGYAAARVDLRGSGNSEGILEGEYLPQEQVDGVEVVRWLAAQPWCTGKVGMIGKSWGGFNALQIAAHAPPELGAVISVCSTDDRYADDVHYIGGCVFASYLLSWASTMLAFNARPPDPKAVGERWRDMWLERLENTPPFIEDWLTHQRRDAFWKQGSVCEDFAAIGCPVYMVGGWADGYPSAILRFLAGYEGPRKGLIGPWGHLYAHDGIPGPAIGFLQECVRWFDHWLKHRETGIMDEPMLRVWMQDAVPPASAYDERPGRWVGEPSWPSPNVNVRRYALEPGALTQGEASPAELLVRGVEAHGLETGPWVAWGTPIDFARDQRAEDGRSLCFTSQPLDDRLELLGVTELTVLITSDRPNAILAVRLCDVAPDGSSTLVGLGVLNLTHRESHEHPVPLVPGEPARATVRIKATAYAFPAGHRIRIGLSPTLWPWAWPPPEPVTLTVLTEQSELILPIRSATEEPEHLRPFEGPEGPAPLQVERLEPGAVERTLRYEASTDRFDLGLDLCYFGSFRIEETGLEYSERGKDVFVIVEGDPLSAEARSDWSIEVGRNDWRTRVETRSIMTSDATVFRVRNILDAYEGSARIFTKTWNFSVPRDLV